MTDCLFVGEDFMGTEATFPAYTTENLFSEEKAMIEAIGELIVDISIWLVLGLVCMKLTAFTWRRIYHFTKDM